MSVIQMRLNARKQRQFRMNSKSLGAHRGFTQKEGIKSKKAEFPFLDEVIGCQAKIEKMKMWL